MEAPPVAASPANWASTARRWHGPWRNISIAGQDCRPWRARAGPASLIPSPKRSRNRAFQYFQGLAATCLYDNSKVVVTGYDGDQPIYDPRFLAFATHYGFRPWACRPRHPQTKGKVERPFWYAEKNLLNGRTFSSLAHLNEVTAHGLATTADARMHQETKRRPIDLYQEEKPHLLPLPAHPYDTAQVLYRTVNPEGWVPYRQNFYCVPWQRMGELLPLRITEKELIVYGPDLTEIARHELSPAGTRGEKHSLPEHSPGRDPYRKVELLKERFAELGAEAVRFLDAILQTRRCGKDEALRVLGLLGTYGREDWSKPWSELAATGLSLFPPWSASWRRRRVPVRTGKRCRRRPENIWTTSSGSLLARLVPRRSINSSWRV